MSSTAAPANSSGISSPPPCEWTVQEIRDLVQTKFGKRPCWYQVKVMRSLYAGKDIIGCAPTGAGKTLSFWIPLLMALEDGREMITIVVTPLNLLGKQNQATLETAGLPAVAVSKENANAETWSVRESVQLAGSILTIGIGHRKGQIPCRDCQPRDPHGQWRGRKALEDGHLHKANLKLHL